MRLDRLTVIVATTLLATACSGHDAAAPVALPVAVEAAPTKAPVPLAAVAPETPTAPIPTKPPQERHSTEPSAACLAQTGDANAPRDATIHRWVDAAGVTHYSDQAPAAGVASHRVIEVHGLPPVKVEASGYDVNLPPDLEHRAVVDTLAVQRVFHEALGIDGPAGMALRIVFVGNADTYGKLIGEPALAASAGTYRLGRSHRPRRDALRPKRQARAGQVRAEGRTGQSGKRSGTAPFDRVIRRRRLTRPQASTVARRIPTAR